jgi:threonine/homoserine/homoserine lactone efflux protein
MSQLDFYLFLTATLILNSTPGPDVLYVLSNYSRGGWFAAIKSAQGLALAYLFYVLITYLGIAMLLVEYPQVFMAVKYLGAFYLIYLGACMLWEMAHTQEQVVTQEQAAVSQKQYLLKGFLVGALNPKVGIFFLAFFPQFLPKDESNTYLILILGSIFCITATCFNLGYCYFGRLFKTFKGTTISHYMSWMPGIIITALGLYMLLT